MLKLKRKVKSICRFVKKVNPFLSDVQFNVPIFMFSFRFVFLAYFKIGCIVIEGAIFASPEVLS